MNDNIPDSSGVYSDYLFTFRNKYVCEKFTLIKKQTNKKTTSRNSLVSDPLNWCLNKPSSIVRFVIKQ